MTRFATVAKFIVALLIPVAQVIQAAVTDDVITPNEWVKVAIAVVGAVGVWAVPNARPVTSRQDLAGRVPTRPVRPEDRRPFDGP